MLLFTLFVVTLCVIWQYYLLYKAERYVQSQFDEVKGDILSHNIRIGGLRRSFDSHRDKFTEIESVGYEQRLQDLEIAVFPFKRTPGGVFSDFVVKSPVVIPADALNPIYLEIVAELSRAELKHPIWPSDIVDCAAIVSEESGELIRSALQLKFEGGSVDAVRNEAVQTAAMAIRLVKNLPA